MNPKRRPRLTPGERGCRDEGEGEVFEKVHGVELGVGAGLVKVGWLASPDFKTIEVCRPKTCSWNLYCGLSVILKANHCC